MKEIIEVETTNHRAGNKDYSFDYKVWRNSELVDEGTIDHRHSRSATYIRKHLKEGWATDIVLEQL